MEKKASRWIEIRPLSTGRFEAGNFKPILDILYNSGKTFRFFMVNSLSSVVVGRRVVKFFLEIEDPELIDYLAKYIRATMNVEVVEAEPPTEIYENCVELEMRYDCALSICSLDERCEENPVDRVVAALSLEEKSAIETTGVADPNARSSIDNYISVITGRRKTLSQIFIDMILGILDAIIGRPPPKPKERLDRESRLTPQIKVKVEAAEKKLNKNLFRCCLKAYGGGKTLNRIMEALPLQLNGFKRYKKFKLVKAPSPLAKPKKRNVENALSNLCWITPLILFILAIYFGALNPLRLNTLDMLITTVAILSGIPFLILFRKKKPIVLSSEELSTIVGLPAEVKRLPVELGTAVHTRDYLPTIEGEKHPEL